MKRSTLVIWYSPEGVEIYALTHGGDETRPVASVHLPRAEEVDEVDEDLVEGIEIRRRGCGSSAC